MPIAVICPSCNAQFRVSDKFAGKQGPCPKCKGTIAIPAAAPEVKIHAPDEAAVVGKDVKGRTLSKPIPRAQTRFSRRTLVLAAGGALVVLLSAWLGGGFLERLLALRGMGVLLISPPLAALGYLAFSDAEDLEPFRGRRLWLRSTICGGIYAALWGAFALLFALVDYEVLIIEYWSWLYVAPPFFVLGAVAALACLDLDFGSAFLHYAFYVLVIVALRFVAGMEFLWAVPGAAG